MINIQIKANVTESCHLTVKSWRLFNPEMNGTRVAGHYSDIGRNVEHVSPRYLRVKALTAVILCSLWRGDNVDFSALMSHTGAMTANMTARFLKYVSFLGS